VQIRATKTFTAVNTALLKQQMLNWANQFDVCCFLDSHNYILPHKQRDCLLAAGIQQTFSPSSAILSQLKTFLSAIGNDWLFGHISYDLKNEIEGLTSSNEDHIGFADIFFFQPQVVLELKGNELHIHSLTNTPDEIYAALQRQPRITPVKNNAPTIQSKISRQTYLEAIQQIRDHILRGDCYEMNYCQEFFATDVIIDCLPLYQHLSELSPAPFSAYYKLIDKYLLSASPERYIKKSGQQIVSQPIKGTLKRTTQDEAVTKTQQEKLYNSSKNRSENVMIVDLVRNDLSKICTEGSVQVEELFGIYSFPQVHQMISTVTGILKEGIDLADILQATFPMGSMTGAPKRSVLQLTEKYEYTKRGIYSGAVGYIAPNGDFDFNVVIRSIMYNATNKYLNYLVGGGITFYSNAEDEYEECLLKAEGMRKALDRES
jgi:para-aminobenzoate synthetase component 1